MIMVMIMVVIMITRIRTRVRMPIRMRESEKLRRMVGKEIRDRRMKSYRCNAR